MDNQKNTSLSSTDLAAQYVGETVSLKVIEKLDLDIPESFTLGGLTVPLQRARD